MKPKKYSQGQHPKSRANLTYHEGRSLTFGKHKKQYGITVIEEGWEGVNDVGSIAKSLDSNPKERLDKFLPGVNFPLMRKDWLDE